jgi:hemerythrin superfamily protein
MDMTPESGNTDVVELLKQQHQRIRNMFDDVEQAVGKERQERFEQLRRFLAVHETAEELVVHPRTGDVAGGKSVVDARLAEERSAKELLSELDGMDAGDSSFSPKFAALRTAVLAHAESEEQHEFPLLQQHTDSKTLARMAKAVKAAEAMAPTHPHPGVESAAANLMAGPLASVVDRTRDAIRSVLGRP